jgi:hypothetical protein
MRVLSHDLFFSIMDRPVRFVRAGESASQDTCPETTSDVSIAEFYRHLVLPKSVTNVDKHTEETSTTDTSVKRDETTWCSTCELDIPICEWEQHQHSITHLMSRSNDTSIPDPLQLNESNLGYRMLQRAGWRYEHGLGAQEQGRRHPIRARIRPPRMGIGVKEKRYASLRKSSPESTIGARQAARRAQAEAIERQHLLAYMKQ